MKPEAALQLCQIVARLADTVENIARETRTSEHELARIGNIRQDTLYLMNDLRKKSFF
ncbi:hypothetical protein [Sphingosinicella humi]|uniref:hypothetical protein n=1 Tax=Allosphingosinicella humi TaxID=2068657 RepID=UPI001304C4A9|nr:hypothetical protein [Sphingosinicella humi]